MSLCTLCAYMKMSSGMWILMVSYTHLPLREIPDFLYSLFMVWVTSLFKHGPYRCLKWKTAPLGVSHRLNEFTIDKRKKNKTFTAEAFSSLTQCDFHFLNVRLLSCPPAGLSLHLLLNFRGACFKYQSVCWQHVGGFWSTGRGCTGQSGISEDGTQGI